MTDHTPEPWGIGAIQDFRDAADAARDAYGAALTAERDAAVADARLLWSLFGLYAPTAALPPATYAALAAKYGQEAEQ